MKDIINALYTHNKVACMHWQLLPEAALSVFGGVLYLSVIQWVTSLFGLVHG